MLVLFSDDFHWIHFVIFINASHQLNLWMLKVTINVMKIDANCTLCIDIEPLQSWRPDAIDKPWWFIKMRNVCKSCEKNQSHDKFHVKIKFYVEFKNLLQVTEFLVHVLKWWWKIDQYKTTKAYSFQTLSMLEYFHRIGHSPAFASFLKVYVLINFNLNLLFVTL